MEVEGSELLTNKANKHGKFILNESAIVFFPTAQQHREVKSRGLSYEDDYRGNALAGIWTENRVEIRFHKNYSDERIRNLWVHVCAGSGLEPLRGLSLFCQGRKLL